MFLASDEQRLEFLVAYTTAQKFFKVSASTVLRKNLLYTAWVTMHVTKPLFSHRGPADQFCFECFLDTLKN